MYRKGKELEYFLVHPGGPFFSKKNEGVWSIPKDCRKTRRTFETAKENFMRKRESNQRHRSTRLGQQNSRAVR